MKNLVRKPRRDLGQPLLRRGEPRFGLVLPDDVIPNEDAIRALKYEDVARLAHVGWGNIPESWVLILE
jgi:hypothetical protein